MKDVEPCRITVTANNTVVEWDKDRGRGLHSSTFQLNLSRLRHTSPCPPV